MVVFCFRILHLFHIVPLLSWLLDAPWISAAACCSRASSVAAVMASMLVGRNATGVVCLYEGR